MAGITAFRHSDVARTRDRVGRWLVAAAAVAIAAATLTPASGQTVPFRPFCIACGELGGVDVILNVLLFMPLGVGLGLAGVRVRRAVTWMAAASVAIELIQLAALPNRDPSVSDVLANSLGGFFGATLGARLDVLLRPTRQVAARLAVAFGAAWLAVQLVAAYALLPSPPHGTYYGQIARDLGTSFVAFPGEVLEPAIDGIAIPDWDFPGERVRDLLRSADGATLRTTVVPRGCPASRAGIVRIADGATREIVVLAQKDADLIFGVRTGAEKLRLRPVRFRLRGVFGEGADCSVRDDSILLSGRYARDAATIRAESRGRMQETRVAPRPTQGWRLVLPVDTYVERRGRDPMLTAAWLLAGLVPLGYWTALAARGGRRRIAIAMGAGVAALGLVAIPLAFGILTAAGWELASAAVGFGVGVAAARYVEATSSPAGSSASIE